MKENRFLKICKTVFGRFSKIQLISIGVIIVIAFFIGDSSIFNRFSNSIKIAELQQQIKYYSGETQKNKEKILELNSGKESIEKFARENYLMKKADEDVFIVE